MRGFAVLLLLATLLLAGCVRQADTSAAQPNGTAPPAGNAGGTGTGTGANATETHLTVSTTGQYPVNPAFDPAKLTGKAGQRIHLTFTDAEALPAVQHDWVLDGVEGAKTKAIGSGESVDITFTLPAKVGDIKYYCDIGDHRSKGLEGTFTITA